jgi:predicted O-methyltransferase YrrM
MTLIQVARRLPPPLRNLLNSGALRGLVRPLKRRSFAMSYYAKPLGLINRWAWLDTEDSNFYYTLTSLNRDQLVHIVASVAQQPYSQVAAYFEELESDAELRTHIAQGIVSANYGRDIRINYGRRVGWYAFVRCLKPKIIVETGVDHGVGACVLTSALLRNAAEGFPGRYYGTEIRTEAGRLLSGKYASVGQILYDDSITSLKKLQGPIDLFINDSDHSSEYEYQEYLTVAEKLAPNAVILGDNSHVTDKLSRFSQERNRRFIFFAEKPEDHWYPGAGIGISF